MAPRFSLAFDPDEACRALARREPRLRALMKRCGPFAIQLRPAATPFEVCSVRVTADMERG